MADAPTWQGDMGRAWARMQEATDRHFTEIGAMILDRLAARPGERVIDLGCGAGTTTRAIAEAVGPDGGVLGVDISSDLVAEANRRLADLPQARVVEADAAAWPFEPEAADALFSRHGCMFFGDPAAAFANLRRGLRPGARAVMSAFAPLAENPWATVPLAAVESVLGPAPAPDAPLPPGPFSWGDPAVFRTALTAAGFRDIAWEGRDATVTVGAGDDPDPVERAYQMTLRIGVTARRLAAEGEEARARVRPALAAAFAPLVRGGWVRLPARVWIVTATA